MSVEIKNNEHLLENLANTKTEWLNLPSGDFYLNETFLATSKWLRGQGVLQTRLHLRGNLWPTVFSKFKDFAIISEPGSVVCDFASFTWFREIGFFSDLPIQSHVKKMSWKEVEARGTAILTTASANPDDAYKIKFYECGFNFLEFGVKITPPPNRAITAWHFYDCEFNGCRYGIWGDWITEWFVLQGNVQLAKLCYMVKGPSNSFVWNHVERSAAHFYIEEPHNILFMADARKDRIVNLDPTTSITLRTHKNPNRKDIS